MNNIIETLSYYFSFPFVSYAFIVAILIAICASLLGATLVLKRYSYIGDGLSHIAFGAMAIALVLDVADVNYLVFPLTALAAVLLLKIGNNRKINGDAVIAMMSVGSLAFGYLLLNIFPTSASLVGDVHSTLFGATSILTLNQEDVITSAALAAVVLAIFILFYNKIFAITFDENFSQATGIKVGNYNLLIAITIAAVIVTAMNLVGALLVSALIIFPALSSMRMFGTFKHVVASSVVIAIICSSVGLVVSILASTPVGATMVIANIIVFIISAVTGKLLRK